MGLDYEKYAKRKYRKKNITRAHIIVLKNIKKSPLLDVGCGDGSFLELAAKKGIECIGIEISKFAVSLCKRKGLRVFHRAIEDLENLMSWKNRFGTITMIDVLEHLNNQTKALEIVYDLLKEDGDLVIVLPNPFSLKSILKLTENPRNDPYHTYCPSLREAKKMMKKIGFEIKKISRLGKFPLPAFLSQAFMIIGKKSKSRV
ncbi:MAG: hypothetical protein DRP00_00670 [Candidatus Aenigmatarchaeota archaeon]|nr:MAG: hypothetical protein DRP00_00670 [Candidatus Aenigmarchaeota archaeon]